MNTTDPTANPQTPDNFQSNTTETVKNSLKRRYAKEIVSACLV